MCTVADRDGCRCGCPCSDGLCCARLAGALCCCCCDCCDCCWCWPGDPSELLRTPDVSPGPAEVGTCCNKEGERGWLGPRMDMQKAVWRHPLTPTQAVELCANLGGCVGRIQPAGSAHFACGVPCTGIYLFCAAGMVDLHLHTTTKQSKIRQILLCCACIAVRVLGVKLAMD